MWPFGPKRSKYGKTCVNSKTVLAHRRMCEVAHGPAPFAKAHAAHTCGNSRCMNPKHLRWATARENNLDRITHGTMPRGEAVRTTVLSADQAVAISQSTLPDVDLAQKYGVTRHAISMIKDGKNWRWATGLPIIDRGYARGTRSGQAKLTEEQVLAIFNDRRTFNVIAAHYGISKAAVEAIKYRRTWKWLTHAA